jgi:hypothetical protein
MPKQKNYSFCSLWICLEKEAENLLIALDNLNCNVKISWLAFSNICGDTSHAVYIFRKIKPPSG